MKYNIALLLLFTNLLLGFSQNKTCIVVDSESKENLSYTAIQFLGNEFGFYTNKTGEFQLNEVKSDSIIITHIGFFTKKINVEDIKDTIFLKSKPLILKEVVLHNKKPKEKKIGYNVKGENLSWHILSKTELTTLIKYNKEIENSYIKEIAIPINTEIFEEQKPGKWKKVSPEFESTFRVHIYSNKNNMPNKRLLESLITIECNQKTGNLIKINISEEHIEYPKEGVFIGVEMISLDKNSKKSLPSFMFTKKNKKYIYSVSFVKSLFKTKEWMLIDNKNFESISNYNMAIGVTLDVY